MAKTLKKHPINENITENIITDNLEEILGQRFRRYSKYIISKSKISIMESLSILLFN